MAKDRDPERDYKVVVVAGDGLFRCFISELGISASGPDVQSAYAAVMERHASLRREFEDAGLAGELPAPETQDAARLSALRFTLLKAAIIVGAVCLGLFAVAVAVNDVSNRIEVAAVKSARAISIKPLLRSLRKELVRAGGANAKRREDLLQEVRQFVVATKPVFDELRPLFAASNAPPCNVAPSRPK